MFGWFRKKKVIAAPKVKKQRTVEKAVAHIKTPLDYYTVTRKGGHYFNGYRSYPRSGLDALNAYLENVTMLRTDQDTFIPVHRIELIQVKIEHVIEEYEE